MHNIVVSKIKSEQWSTVSYNEESKNLTLSSPKNKDRSVDKIIIYSDVPKIIFEELVNSEDLDKYIEDNIDPKYTKKLKTGFSGMTSG